MCSSSDARPPSASQVSMSRILFRKRLSSTDVKHRLCFPSKKLQYLPPFEGLHRMTLPVYYTYGNEFKRCEIRCVIRKKIYRKPVLEGGWRRIVREKGLRQGDCLEFYQNTTDGSYSIVVKRTIRLCGKNVVATV